MGMFMSVLGLVASSFLVGQGLTGKEVTVEHQINDRWEAGVSYSRSSMDLLKIDDVEIDVRLMTLRANYYPLRGNWFLSGGVVHNNSRADYKENFSETITASVLDFEQSYTINAKVKANMTYPKIGIYLGTGYNIPVSNNIDIRLQAGANYVGRPTIKGNLQVENLPKELEPAVRGYAENELDEVRSDFDYRWWPAASIAIMYRW